MIRFASDEDFDARIVEGLRLRLPAVDVVSVRDIGLGGAGDPQVLEWAASAQRALLTHDVSTMLAHANERLGMGRSHAGVVKVPQALSIGRAVADLVVVAEAAGPQDFRDRILHLPL